MLVLHANWTGGALRVWGETLAAYLAPVAEPVAVGGEETFNGAADSDHGAHRFAMTADAIEAALRGRLGAGEAALLDDHRVATVRLRLPHGDDGPAPSDRLAAAAGRHDESIGRRLLATDVPCLVVDPAATLELLIALDDAGPDAGVEFGHGLRYWVHVARFVLELLAAQRFIPTLRRLPPGRLEARWQPWLLDEPARERVSALLAAMPPVVRAAIDEHDGRPWPLLEEALRTLVDVTVRDALVRDDFADAIADRDPADEHVAWLGGLLGPASAVGIDGDGAADLLRDVAAWVGRLDDSGRAQPWHLYLRLWEPEIDEDDLPELGPPPASARWRVGLHLRSTRPPHAVIEAEQIWGLDGRAGVAAPGAAPDRADELLLTEIGRAARVWPRLESALDEALPTGIDCTTEEVFELLTEIRPVLEESGIEVEAPAWWDAPESRFGARLQIESDEPAPGGASVGRAADRSLGLQSLVRFRWRVAVGDEPLSEDEFARLAGATAPIARVRGRWVALDPKRMRAAAEFLREHPGGELTLLEAIRLAHGEGDRRPALPVLGLDASGWVGDLLDGTGAAQRIPDLDQPPRFRGTLRPYQRRGLSWLAFLDALGLGACLADDMGLGKTIQLIALLQHEREQAAGAGVGPTLLLVPTSLTGNWERELHRFAPELRCLVHHGPDRLTGDAFADEARARDVVISTYGLVSRDRESLERVHWHRVVLDEAQSIKNPPTKQTGAIRALRTDRRIALTGTPVENRLSELWSIMEFCNPGYLGPAAEFRRRFSVPIERHRDRERAEMLRQLVRPFVLRRLKTDPTVIDDLPPCVQTREYANLTPEQASLYQEVVDEMLGQVDRAEGIQRRGLVLSTLVRLKQVCNHPALLEMPRGSSGASAVPPVEGPGAAHRSGKSQRLIRMLDEVVSTGDRALVFTQFRRMGHLLTALIEHELDTTALFLHGGTPQAKRQQLIDRFQDPRGDAPVFVLSLKAGGVGLNLTAATHVFHFDRWWNPAVENQATDRAFRIGQTRSVHVHKFVCTGTLEERIDQMIEQKTELARHIIGSGEQWITEMTSSQLRDVLTLRRTALELDA